MPTTIMFLHAGSEALASSDCSCWQSKAQSRCSPFARRSAQSQTSKRYADWELTVPCLVPAYPSIRPVWHTRQHCATVHNTRCRQAVMVALCYSAQLAIMCHMNTFCSQGHLPLTPSATLHLHASCHYLSFCVRSILICVHVLMICPETPASHDTLVSYLVVLYCRVSCFIA